MIPDALRLEGEIHEGQLRSLLIALGGGFVGGATSMAVEWYSIVVGIAFAAVAGYVALARLPSASTIATQWNESDWTEEADHS